MNATVFKFCGAPIHLFTFYYLHLCHQFNKITKNWIRLDFCGRNNQKIWSLQYDTLKTKNWILLLNFGAGPYSQRNFAMVLTKVKCRKGSRTYCRTYCLCKWSCAKFMFLFTHNWIQLIDYTFVVLFITLVMVISEPTNTVQVHKDFSIPNANIVVIVNVCLLLYTSSYSGKADVLVPLYKVEKTSITIIIVT